MCMCSIYILARETSNVLYIYIYHVREEGSTPAGAIKQLPMLKGRNFLDQLTRDRVQCGDVSDLFVQRYKST